MGIAFQAEVALMHRGTMAPWHHGSKLPFVILLYAKGTVRPRAGIQGHVIKQDYIDQAKKVIMHHHKEYPTKQSKYAKKKIPCVSL